MSQSAIEKAANALVDFEDDLALIKQAAVEARKKLYAQVTELSARAKSDVLSQVQVLADDNVAATKAEAEKEALSLISKRDDSLETLKERISSRKKAATELVVQHLLGE